MKKTLLCSLVGLLLAAIAFAGRGDFVQEGLQFENIEGGIITGRSKHVNLGASGETYYVLDMSGVSGVWLSAVSDPARPLTAGVSVFVQSPTASGYDVVFLMGNETFVAGTTLTILFEEGDTLASADTIIAGTSAYQLSGTTAAQIVVLHSTGTSVWYVETKGSPSVVWD